MISVLRRWLAAFATAAALVAATPAVAQDLTLTGVMTGADHQTYREVPFRVPAGVTAVTVEFAYTGKEQKSVIDLGLRDPQRLRGWSGGNKQRFTVAEAWATPSYLPGPLPPGTWKLILGVPNLRKDARAEYTAKITFERGVFHGFAEAPLKAGPGWYRGDLHMHTAHSDGSCAAQSGKRVPCPLYRTVESAAARGLDFIATTDHNTISQAQAMAELQPAFDQLLLIPGREITTFYGHANVFGVTTPMDFQLGSPRAPTLDQILDQAQKAGGLVSINHPSLPSGEVCMGCGWTAASTDFSRIAAIEVVNADRAEGPLSGLAFWETQLNAGRHITAIGGSDNHDAAAPPARGVGVPTTVVYADALSQDAILAGIRARRVFIDVLGTRDRVLDVTARASGRTAGIGDVLRGQRHEFFALQIRVAHAAGGHVVIVGSTGDRIELDEKLTGDEQTIDVGDTEFGAEDAHWWRVEVRGPDDKLWLLANPIYLEITP